MLTVARIDGRVRTVGRGGGGGAVEPDGLDGVCCLAQGAAPEKDLSDFDEDVTRLQSLVRTLQARRDALLAEAVRLRQKGPLPPLLRPGSSRAAGAPLAPGPSAYHGGCGAEQVPPPTPPWPPQSVDAIK